MDNDTHINELLQELSDCREDERNIANQILSVIGAAGTILGVILTAGIFSSNGNESVELGRLALTQDELMRCVFVLSNLVFCTACAYAITLGISAVLRYHYIRKIEDELSQLIPMKDETTENTFVHWMSFSGAFVTRNMKHVKGVNGWLYFIGYTIATTCVGIFCIAMMLIEFALIKNHIWIDKILLLIPVITTLITLGSFWITSMCSGGDATAYIELAKSRRKNRLTSTSSEGWMTPRLAIYLIYPKTKDLQKPGLIVIGYMLHTLLRWDPSGYQFWNWNWNEYIPLLWDRMPVLLWLLFMFDFLAYQMRYQINDLRGLKQDLDNKKSPIPGVLDDKNTQKIVAASLIVIFVRAAVLIISLVISWKIDPVMTSGFGLLLIFLLLGTIGYEYFRSRKENDTIWKPQATTLMIFLLVGIGYPLRFLVGAIAAGYMCKWSVVWSCILIFELYGIYAAVLPWKSQILKNKDKNERFSKLHYNVMAAAEHMDRKSCDKTSFIIKYTDVISFLLVMLICVLAIKNNITSSSLLAYYTVIALFALITFGILQMFIPRPCEPLDKLKKMVKEVVLFIILGKDTSDMMKNKKNAIRDAVIHTVTPKK